MNNNFRPGPNSFKNTFCVFKEFPLKKITNLRLQYESKSRSQYFYTNEGMFRFSNHWGRLANSKWRLEPMEPETSSKTKLGFALWTDFHPDNPDEKLYFIEVDYNKKLVHYQHKNVFKYDGKAILRNSFDTAKKIKQIRNLFNLTSWAKHFEYDDLDVLREKIISKLVYTDRTLEQIKREL
jgi:hypothetical protein